MTPSLESYIDRVRRDVDGRLSEILGGHPGAPARLVEALRYAVLGPGKRMRPLLVVASGEAVRGSTDRDRTDADLLDAACALELIHTFSLIHDDLPSLDDDDLRRGRATLHVKFDEALAILSGDSLLNMAYETLSALPGGGPGALDAIRSVSRAVGLGGMISGQVLDLDSNLGTTNAGELETIHRFKTGALIAASCETGGVIAGGDRETLARLRGYGERIGLAFQIVDDILDIEGTADALGKSPGKDARDGKATYPALLGMDTSRKRAATCIDEACALLDPLGAGAAPLRGIARAILTRRR